MSDYCLSIAPQSQMFNEHGGQAGRSWNAFEGTDFDDCTNKYNFTVRGTR